MPFPLIFDPCHSRPGNISSPIVTTGDQDGVRGLASLKRRETMPLQRWTRLVVAAGFSLAALGSFMPAGAEEKPGAGDPRVERIVKAALQHIAAAKGIAFEARVVNEVPLDSGQKVQNISTL